MIYNSTINVYNAVDDPGNEEDDCCSPRGYLKVMHVFKRGIIPCYVSLYNQGWDQLIVYQSILLYFRMITTYFRSIERLKEVDKSCVFIFFSMNKIYAAPVK